MERTGNCSPPFTNTLGCILSTTAANQEMRKRSALKLFFYALTPAIAVGGLLLVWKQLVGAVPELAVQIAYALVVVCFLVCLFAVVRFYVVHFKRAPDAT